MNNMSNKKKVVSFEMWLSRKPMLWKGFISVYDNEPFNPDFDSSAYEMGRQLAIEAKNQGYKTKGTLLRKKPKSTEYAWVKTRLAELETIARSLGWKPSNMLIRN